MKTVDKAFRRMGELAMLARDETKSSDDRALYDQEFQQLKDYVLDSTKKEFNSVALFDGADIAVTIDSEGDTFDMAGIDMTMTNYTNALVRSDKSVGGITTDSTTNLLTRTAHGYSSGDAIIFAEDAPGGLTADTTTYFVEYVDDDTFYLHADKADAIAGTAANRVAITDDSTNLLAFGPPTAADVAAGLAEDPDGAGVMTAIDDVSIGIHIQTADGAANALTKVKTAISQVAQDRAALGAVQSRLNFTNEQLSVTKENLSSAISRIADVDVAEEATQYARYQILVQSGTSMLQQANQLPQAALQLLRG